MNWDAIGAIAELLGAIGVIASLVYLATQIRHGQEQMAQNTRAMRAAAYREFNEHMHNTMFSAIATPGLAKIVRCGMADPGQLDEDAAFEFAFWVTGVLHAYENAYYQHRLGMLDEDRWKMHRLDLALLLKRDGIGLWWSRDPDRSTYSPEFVALVEDILGEVPDRGDG